VANPAASIAYQPFDFVPIATQLFSAALPNPVTSLAIVIPHFFRIHHDRAARVSVWCERALQSSISFLNFSAPAHLPSDVQISDSASGCGRIYTGPVIALHRNCQAIDTVPQFDMCVSDSKGQVSLPSACMFHVASALHQLLALLAKGTPRASSTQQAAACKKSKVPRIADAFARQSAESEFHTNSAGEEP
jgi:hypothetical protein